ncbi:uncharacterized protein V6R79_011364 [Siganus canaliculatus]
MHLCVRSSVKSAIASFEFISCWVSNTVRVILVCSPHPDQSVGPRREDNDLKMLMNSSSSVNDSVAWPNGFYCQFTSPTSFIFGSFYITRILILLPLSSLVLYCGVQKWRSTASGAKMSHSDVFTYHMAAMELISILGSTCSFYGIYRKDIKVSMLGYCLHCFEYYGETSFHLLTCAERYLAVVHPITYLSLRGERGIRLRNMAIACSWLLSLGAMCLITVHSVFVVTDFILTILTLVVVSFSSLYVLCILIRPGPGEKGGDRERVDKSKRSAFYTIGTILAALLVRCVWNMAWIFLGQRTDTATCVAMAVGNWFDYPSSLVLPLLFLYRSNANQWQSDTGLQSTNGGERERSEGNTLKMLNDSVVWFHGFRCHFTSPSSFIISSLVFTRILILLPLSSLILYCGVQKWRSTSSGAKMSHSDVFTYHMAAIELISVLGSTCSCYGIYRKDLNVSLIGHGLGSFTYYGETFFHMLTCAERYLAVVHPITYLSLRGVRGIRLRNMAIACAWLLSLGQASLMTLQLVFVIAGLSLNILTVFFVSFCSLSVLRVLIRPGPGEQGGDREAVDQLKRSAFNTIAAILAALLVRNVWSMIWMLMNSSSSVNDSVAWPYGFRCHFTNPSSFIITSFYFTRILILLPLCSLVLYWGVQKWRQQRSTSPGAKMSHSDVFTYHMAAMELISVLGSTCSCYGIYRRDMDVSLFGYGLRSITYYGETFFHMVTCAERYLALVHPIAYLSMKDGQRATRLRNVSIACVWLLSLGETCLMTLQTVFMVTDFSINILTLLFVIFCSLSVLRVLIRPGPGEQGGDREAVDQLKKSAFNTIVVILAALLTFKYYVMSVQQLMFDMDQIKETKCDEGTQLQKKQQI